MTAFSPFGKGKKDDKGGNNAPPPAPGSPLGEKKVLGGLGAVPGGGLFGRKQAGSDVEHIREEASLVVRTVNHGHVPYQKIVLGLEQGEAASGQGQGLGQKHPLVGNDNDDDKRTIDDGAVPLNWRYSHENKDSDQAHGLGLNASMTGLGQGLHNNKPYTYSAVLFLSASSLFVSKQSIGPSPNLNANSNANTTLTLIHT